MMLLELYFNHSFSIPSIILAPKYAHTIGDAKTNLRDSIAVLSNITVNGSTIIVEK